jgi:hypothetical protein
MCEGCEPDAINNPKCPQYSPVAIKDFEVLQGRFVQAVSKLEEDLK